MNINSTTRTLRRAQAKITLSLLCLGTILTHAPARAMDFDDTTTACTILTGFGLTAIAGCGLSNWLAKKDMCCAVSNFDHQNLLTLVQKKTGSIEKRTFGTTPFFRAVGHSNKPAAVILLAAGAKPNVFDTDPISLKLQRTSNTGIGETALNCAVRKLDKDLVSLCIATGASPYVKDRLGQTAFERVEKGWPADYSIVDHTQPDLGPAVRQLRSDITDLLQSPQAAKKHVVQMVRTRPDIQNLPESVKRNLFNRINVGQMDDAVTEFLQTGSDTQLRAELNKNRWMIRHAQQKNCSLSTLPLDVVRRIATFLDRNQLSTTEIKKMLCDVEKKASFDNSVSQKTQDERGNRNLLALVHEAQVNEEFFVTPDSKNSQAKWRKNHRGFYRVPKYPAYA